MTVSYTSKVATSSHLAFLKLIFRWKGSVYKVVWFDFVVFSIMYACFSLVYRIVLTGENKRNFEYFCIYCLKMSNLIPVGFVLGFYVNLIVSRWWEQFMAIPWPDSLATLVSAYASGTTERAKMQRRTFLRYINLTFCLTTRDISSRARLRFPTLDHLVSAGLITDDELELFKKSAPDGSPPLYFLPLVWAQELVTIMHQEGNILQERAVELLTTGITKFRGQLATLFAYDWINVPLAYTQISTITVYGYFTFSIFAWQYLETNVNSEVQQTDLYVPVFGLLRLLFYMGWLKVAETLINPFGNDADDFEIEEIIERNLEFSFFWTQSYDNEIPPITRDVYWNADDINLPAVILESGDLGRVDGQQLGPLDEPFSGSLANVNYPIDRRKMSIFA